MKTADVLTNGALQLKFCRVNYLQRFQQQERRQLYVFIYGGLSDRSGRD